MRLARLFNFVDPAHLAHNPLGLIPALIDMGADRFYAEYKPTRDVWTMDELLDVVPSTMFNRVLGLWTLVERKALGPDAVTGQRIPCDMRGFESVDDLEEYVPDFVSATRKRTERMREKGGVASIYIAPEAHPCNLAAARDFCQECGFDIVNLDLASTVVASKEVMRLPEALVESSIGVRFEPMGPVSPKTFPQHDGRFGCQVLWSTFDARNAEKGGVWFGTGSGGVHRDGIDILIQGGSPERPSERVALVQKYGTVPGVSGVTCELNGNTMEEIVAMVGGKASVGAGVGGAEESEQRKANSENEELQS